MDTFNTIKAFATSDIIKVKGSKFIGLAFPIKNEGQVEECIEKVKKIHKSASHYCYAWQLGTTNILTRANDDGEPHNSAGKPILGQIIAKDLTNVLIVVVRYYGGTKLGVGGLITSYKESAQLAIENAEILKKTINIELALSYSYKDLNTVMRIIKQLNLKITNQELHLDCTTNISVRKSKSEEIFSKFQELKGITVKYV